MDRGALFHSLFNAFVKAFPNKKRQQCQFEAVEFWNVWKEKDAKVLEEKVEKKIKELEGLVLTKQGKLLQFWGKSLTTTAKPTSSTESTTKSMPKPKGTDNATPSTSGANKRSTPAQESLTTQLNDVNSQVVFLSDRKSSGLLTDDEYKQLENLKNKKIKLEKDMKLKVNQQARQQKYRDKTKQAKLQLMKDIPEAGTVLH